MNRYKVIKGSESGHLCCFEFTVVDTSRPRKHLERLGLFTEVCECFEEEDADKICNALNAAEQSIGDPEGQAQAGPKEDLPLQD